MRVLYLTGMYPTKEYPQKGIFCHEQVKALVRLGIEVTVAVPVPFYSLEMKKWEYEGICIIYVPYFKFPKAFCFQNSGKFLSKAIKKYVSVEEYDIIHAHVALPEGQAAMLLSEEYHIPYIVTIHSLDVFMDDDYQHYKNCWKIVNSCKNVYKGANAVTGVSQKVIDRVCQIESLREKSFVVYNGVDVRKFHPYEGIINESGFRIVSIGNLVPLKGHDITIKAFSRLVKKGYKDLRLTIYGRGYLQQDLKEIVAEEGMEDRIDFKGYVPYDLIAEDLPQYDLFVLPSWFEAIGCVYLEAMASGVLPIGCLGNGIDEVIVHDYNGWLVRPHNIDDVENIIESAINEKASPKYLQMRENAICTVVERYTWEKSSQELVKIYEKIKSVL